MVTKRSPWDMGTYYITPKQYKASAWCIENNIVIYPVPHTVGEWHLEIDIAGKKKKSPYLYKKNMIWEKLHEYYEYYYDKYSK